MDLEVIDESHFTWEIEGWRSMDRKVHSPTFKCGSCPWLVLFNICSRFTVNNVLLGGYCSFLMAMVTNVPRYILSMGLKGPIRCQMDGIAVYSLAWSFGTHGSQSTRFLIVSCSSWPYGNQKYC